MLISNIESYITGTLPPVPGSCLHRVSTNYLHTIYTLSTHYLKTIYKLSTQAHSHQIRGHVYIVDKNHLYIRKFSYDGGGSLDAYFWVKSTITIHSREYQSNTP